MRRLGIIVGGILALAGAPAFAAENLLTNGSFESRVVTMADTCGGAAWCVRSFASTPGWTQIGDGVDLVHNNYLQGPAVVLDASDGVNFLDMNQLEALGGVVQTVSALSGTSYTLNLDIGGWALNGSPGAVKFSLLDGNDSSVISSSTFAFNDTGTWHTQTLSGIATSNLLTVRIEATAAFQAGPGVDNVLLTTGVPEPSAWGLMILGFGTAGAMLRRRRLAV